MNLKFVQSILKFIGDLDRVIWQLAGPASRHKARTQPDRQRRPEDEAPCLGSDNEIDVEITHLSGELVDRQLKRRRIDEQWCDVSEDDAGTWEVWNIPDPAA